MELYLHSHTPFHNVVLRHEDDFRFLTFYQLIRLGLYSVELYILERIWKEEVTVLFMVLSQCLREETVGPWRSGVTLAPFSVGSITVTNESLTCQVYRVTYYEHIYALYDLCYNLQRLILRNPGSASRQRHVLLILAVNVGMMFVFPLIHQRYTIYSCCLSWIEKLRFDSE